MFNSLYLSVLMASVAFAATNTPYIQQSYFFDWNDPSQPVPIPVTHQCSTINIKWSRAAAQGPNPSPPYFLQIYTSTSIEPFLVPAGIDLKYDFVVPFPVGTMYQICMFDKNGYTGGCQGIYTVIEPFANATRCNTIEPMGTLAVDGTVDNGPISRYGWIDSCTDISVLPKNGTPPFIFTIAPSLHPPYNITSQYATPINWTVVLSWASPFFISVFDSAGNGWSQGPLHSGGNGKTWCLNTDGSIPPNSTNTTTAADNTVPKSTAIAAGAGAGVGGLILGALIGGLLAFCVYKKRRAPSEQMRPHLDQFANYHKSNRDSDRPTDAISPLASPLGHQPSLPGVMHNQGINSHPGVSPQHSEFTYNRDSYATSVPPMGTHPSHPGTGPYMNPNRPQYPASHHGSHDPTARSDIDSIAGPSSSRDDRPAGERVYIVHNDSGRPPVQVYTSGGADVVELPPQYDNNSAPPGAGSVSKQRQTMQNYGQHPSQSRVSIEGQTSPRRTPLPQPPVPRPPSGY